VGTAPAGLDVRATPDRYAARQRTVATGAGIFAGDTGEIPPRDSHRQQRDDFGQSSAVLCLGNGHMRENALEPSLVFRIGKTSGGRAGFCLSAVTTARLPFIEVDVRHERTQPVAGS